VQARTGPHLLVTGPTNIGKSRRVLVPAAVLWAEGPVTFVSSKDNEVELIAERRPGPKAIVDLRPVRAPVYPEDVRVYGYDPTATIETPMDALTVADAVMAMSTAGLSGGESRGDSATWEANASGPLAAFLYAASPLGHGGGMPWVLRAVNSMGIRAPRTKNPNTPAKESGWQEAARHCARYDELAIGLEAISRMGPGQRDSVAITMRKAVTPWLRMALAARFDPTLQAPPFTPGFLDDPSATLFVLSPAEGTTAGAAVTLIDSLVRRWRDKTAARQQVHRMLLIIDELPNTAPIPSLRRIVGEARGLGINMMAAVQDTKSLATVYGASYCDELRAIFPAKLVMYGALEREILEAGQEWAGFITRRTQTVGEGGKTAQAGGELGPAIRWSELLPEDREHARLLRAGDVGEIVRIPDWSVLGDEIDRQMKQIADETRLVGHRRVLAKLGKRWKDPRP